MAAVVPRRGAVWFGIFAAGLAFGGVSLTIARRDPGYSFGGASLAAGAAELLTGWCLIAAGFAGWQRRPGSRFGPLLVAAGFAWFLPEWTNPGVSSAFVFTTGLALFAAVPPLVAHAMLSYPEGPLSGAERVATAVGYAGALLVIGVLPTLVFDPAGRGCSECPDNLLLIHADEDAVDAVTRLGLWLGLAWAVALVVLAGRRLARSTVARRWLVAPVLVPGIAYLGLVGGDFAHSLGRGFLSNDPLDRRLWLGQAAALTALALGSGWEWVRGQRTRSALARLVVDVASSPPPGRLAGLLAGMLGDPALEVLYPLPDGRRVDAHGHSAEPGPTQAVTQLVRGGRPVAFLAHRPGLLDDPGLVEEIAAAARLALEKERLQAEARTQLADLRASRARIVEIGDAERRRLERDLHDGAQQRLVALALSVRLAGMQVGQDAEPALAAPLEEAEAELRSAVADLRGIAHGLYPGALAEEGLAAGLEALAEGNPSLVLGSLPEQRFAPSIESAAYFVVAETLKRSRGGHAAVEASGTDGLLVVDVESDTGPPEELTDLEDRIGALDGRLAVERTPGGGTRIRAELPCVS
jgi:signal transduction histidine kinase